MYRQLSRICGTITAFMAIGLIAVIIALVGPRLAGWGTYAVLSGSMEPAFPVGSIVYVDKRVSGEKIKVGDPITFLKADSLMATHRVISIDEVKKEFTTKGDANETQDLEPVPFDRLVGRAGAFLPGLGYIALYAKTAQGLLAGGGLFILLLLLYLVPELFKPEEMSPKKAFRSPMRK